MQPKDEQSLPGGNEWVVSFDRGNGKGTAEYTVGGGSYEFRVDEDGWDLFQKSFEPTLDNSGSPTPFSYLLDDQPQSVPPGRSQTIKGKYPPILEFDDGSGKAKKRFLEGSEYRVALNSQSKLDIYPADQVPPTGKWTQARLPDDLAAGIDNPQTISLPPGFKLFSPTEALTKPEVAMSLPPEFSLFRESAEAVAAQDAPSSTPPPAPSPTTKPLAARGGDQSS